MKKVTDKTYKKVSPLSPFSSKNLVINHLTNLRSVTFYFISNQI